MQGMCPEIECAATPHAGDAGLSRPCPNHWVTVFCCSATSHATIARACFHGGF